MRRCLPLIALLVFAVRPPALAAPGPDAAGTPLDSAITHVTVYPEWAYVIRTATVDLKAGDARLSLDELPAWIDSESIRVSIDNPDGITLQGASTRTTYLARSTQEEVNAAEDKVTALSDQIEDLNAELAVLQEMKQYLSELKVYSVAATPQEAAVRDVSVEEMAAVQAHLKEQMLDNARATAKVQRQVRDLRPKLQAAQRAFNDLRSRIQLEQKQIVIDLTAEKPGKATLRVGYLISGASWYPAYDARTQSANGKLELSARAIVQQSTGEDWTDASLTLSTIQPYLTREKPELTPWIIGRSNMPDFETAQADNLGALLTNSRSGGNEFAVQRLSKVQSRQFEYNRNNAEAQAAWAQVCANSINLRRVVRAVEDRGTTVEFDVAGTHTVTADGKPAELPLGQAALAAAPRYSSAPAVSKSTYQTAQMRNTGPFPVLPGEVRIYTDGSFVAKSSLPFVAQNEKFELFLGLDERIKVTRELDYSKSSTASWSGKKRMSVAYQIEVKNYYDRAVTIDVSDQIPVSEDKQIAVKVEDITPGTDAMDKGILTWNLTLEPGETKTLRFAFRVDYPPSLAAMPAELQMLEQQILSK